MADWATLPIDILVLIAERVEFFEDFIGFCVVCKSWQSVTSILGKSRTLPPRFPWVMLTDIAEKKYPLVTRDMYPSQMLVEEVEKNEHIEGMHNRRFFSFSTSKTHEFELPEATRKKCLGVSYGWLLTIGYDLQINLLHPFTRQQINMPPLLSFKDQYDYDEDFKPQEVVHNFVKKAVMSSNPHKISNQDCIILAIYGEFRVLAFARPGDEIWTNIFVPSKSYDDVIYYKEKLYAVDCHGVVYVCDIDDVNNAKATAIACIPDGFQDMDQKYLVESSGFLLLVIRFRFLQRVLDDEQDIDRVDCHTRGFSTFRLEECHGDVLDDEQDIDRVVYLTRGFSIYALEKCEGNKSIHNYPYRLTRVDSLGENALFIGYNASVSVPSSKCVKGNCIYFSEDNTENYVQQPYGGGYDTGIFDVERGSISSHYGAEFISHLTPPIWFI